MTSNSSAETLDRMIGPFSSSMAALSNPGFTARRQYHEPVRRSTDDTDMVAHRPPTTLLRAIRSVAEGLFRARDSHDHGRELPARRATRRGALTGVIFRASGMVAHNRTAVSSRSRPSPLGQLGPHPRIRVMGAI